MNILSPFHSLLDPVEFARELCGFWPDPWQQAVLDPTIQDGMLCCSRQSGKTTAVVNRAVQEVVLREGATVLIVSATESHSIEVVLRIRALLDRLGVTYRKLPGRQHDYFVPETQSRFLALPCTEKAARSLTATLIILDEAAKVPDKVWYALAGTQAATSERASTWMLSTPAGHSGFFAELWHAPDETWTRIRVPATECGRIRPEFLAQRQRELPPWVFAQEFLCQFGDAARAVFRDEDIQAALNWAAAPPRMLSARPAARYYLGLDLGQCRDHSAIAIVEASHVPRGTIDPYTRQALSDVKLRVRHLERLPLDMPYPDVVERVRQLVMLPEYLQRIVVIPDCTGGGGIFLDHLRAARMGVQIVPASITPGQEPNEAKGRHNLPKHHLITILEAMFRERRIGLDRECPHLKELIQELHAFERLAGPRGRETFTGKASHHDDLVLALALAVWRAVEGGKGDLLSDKGIFRQERLL